MPAAILHGAVCIAQDLARQPDTGIGVHILVQPRRSVGVAVRGGILQEQGHKIPVRYDGVFFGIQVFNHGSQGLCRGKGPYGTVPKAIVRMELHVVGVPRVCGAQAVRCKEAIGVQQVAEAPVPSLVGKPVYPGNVAHLLADVLRFSAVGEGAEHTDALVVQLFIEESAQAVCLQAVALCLLCLSQPLGNACQGIGIGSHIGVERGAQAVSRDGIFHTVTVAGLGVKTAFGFVVVPGAVNGAQVRVEGICKAGIARHVLQRQHAVREREAIQARIAHRAPEARVFLQR